ncbi:translation initiation factor IF-2-like [Apodemus sylvaticus]|uniref:translation initiation factor IF-2-like n=1 Tax=Apodemus sylvaticus TaxID=10129 RepID=UPI002241DA21|nr:translation initiation factor IF-2-like [Apodemus sylvaticus]
MRLTAAGLASHMLLHCSVKSGFCPHPGANTKRERPAAPPPYKQPTGEGSGRLPLSGPGYCPAAQHAAGEAQPSGTAPPSSSRESPEPPARRKAPERERRLRSKTGGPARSTNRSQPRIAAAATPTRLPLGTGPGTSRLPGDAYDSSSCCASTARIERGLGAWPRGRAECGTTPLWAPGQWTRSPEPGLVLPGRRSAAQQLPPDLCVDAPQAGARFSVGAGGILPPAPRGSAGAQCQPGARESGTIGSRRAVPATPQHKSGPNLPLTLDKRAPFFFKNYEIEERRGTEREM